MRLFAEELTASQGPECPVYADVGGCFPPNGGYGGGCANPLPILPVPGDTLNIFVQVGISPLYGNLIGNLTIEDTIKNGGTAYWPSNSPTESYPLPTPADYSTAEWIAENPSQENPPQMPAIAPVNFTDLVVNGAYGSTSHVGAFGPFALANASTPATKLVNISGHLVQQQLLPAIWPGGQSSNPVAMVQYKTI